MPTNVAVIAVDVQQDFLPGGALAVPRGDEVIEPILERAGLMPMVATMDYHPADHSQFKEQGGPWPAHCVQGTEGILVDERLGEIAQEVFLKGIARDKDGYSGFEDTELEEWLRGHGIEYAIVTGLALDYCVKATALDAKRLGFGVAVPLECTAPVTQETGQEAVRELRAAGVEVS